MFLLVHPEPALDSRPRTRSGCAFVQTEQLPEMVSSFMAPDNMLRASWLHSRLLRRYQILQVKEVYSGDNHCKLWTFIIVHSLTTKHSLHSYVRYHFDNYNLSIIVLTNTFLRGIIVSIPDIVAWYRLPVSSFARCAVVWNYWFKDIVPCWSNDFLVHAWDNVYYEFSSYPQPAGGLLPTIWRRDVFTVC